MDTELKNPFVEAKIVQVDADPVAYHNSSPVKDRGKKEFIMSASALRTFMDCPRKWYLGFERKESDATEWGGVHDCIFTSAQRFNDRYSVEPKTYPAGPKHEKVKSGEVNEGDPLPWHAGATYCKEWVKSQNGKQIISDKLYKEVLAAQARVVKAQDFFHMVLCSSDKQVFVMATYRDAATKIEVPFKMLLDLVPRTDHKLFSRWYGKSIVDLKSSSCCRPSAWDKDVNDYGYDIQGAAYLFGYRLATGEDRQDFRHLVQESHEPYEYMGFFLSQEWIEVGASKLVSGLAFYCQCLAKNEWPSYSTEGRMVLDGFAQTMLLPWMLK